MVFVGFASLVVGLLDVMTQCIDVILYFSKSLAGHYLSDPPEHNRNCMQTRNPSLDMHASHHYSMCESKERSCSTAQQFIPCPW